MMRHIRYTKPSVVDVVWGKKKKNIPYGRSK